MAESGGLSSVSSSAAAGSLVVPASSERATGDRKISRSSSPPAVSRYISAAVSRYILSSCSLSSDGSSPVAVMNCIAGVGLHPPAAASRPSWDDTNVNEPMLTSSPPLIAGASTKENWDSSTHISAFACSSPVLMAEICWDLWIMASAFRRKSSSIGLGRCVVPWSGPAGGVSGNSASG